MLLVGALLSGLLFGAGLTISQMIDPARVIGFLDVTGRWDLTLALVMAGALAVTAVAFPFILGRKHPVYCDEFDLPAKTAVDRRLLSGAVIFGIGWGLAGFCPGPAIAALLSGEPGVYLFVAGMIGGQWISRRASA